MTIIRFISAALLMLMLVIVPSSGFARMQVTVSILPQQYFVQKIGGSLVDVRVMVPTGADPQTYVPTEQQIADASYSRIYVRAGFAAEEDWVERVLSRNRNIMVVKSDTGIDKPPISSYALEKAGDREPVSESAAAAGSPTKDRLDPHVWLSPPLVKRQARQILRGLALMDRGNTNVYHGYYLEFYKEINSLDSRLRNIFGRTPEVAFIGIPPAWGIFASTYGARQFAVHADALSAETEAYQNAVSLARERGIRIVLGAPNASTGLGKRLAGDIEGKWIPADPMAANWSENLEKVAREIAAASTRYGITESKKSQ